MINLNPTNNVPETEDMFSEEALNIAKSFHEKYPNTWDVMYHNGLMPEMIKFILEDRQRVEIGARISEHTDFVMPFTDAAIQYEMDGEVSGILYFDNARLGRYRELKAKRGGETVVIADLKAKKKEKL